MEFFGNSHKFLFVILIGISLVSCSRTPDKIDEILIQELNNNPRVKGLVQVRYLATQICIATANQEENRSTILAQLNKILAEKAATIESVRYLPPDTKFNSTLITAILGTNITTQYQLEQEEGDGQNSPQSRCVLNITDGKGPLKDLPLDFEKFTTPKVPPED